MARRATSTQPQALRRNLSDYWSLTHQPLYCLVFLLPLVLTYEFGALLLRISHWPERQLVAVRLVRDALGLFGASGLWLPGVAVLLTLLIWHLLSRRAWQVRAWVPLGMAVESILLTPPLFALNVVKLAAGAADGPRLAEQMVLALGAGIYEELIFRLGLISGLLLLLVDVLRVPRRVAVWLALGLSAVLFALCHCEPIGSLPLAWGTVLLYALAGAYLGLVYLWRGLGVSTGCHALYNLGLTALAAA
jgi:hypothetical protein